METTLVTKSLPADLIASARKEADWTLEKFNRNGSVQPFSYNVSNLDRFTSRLADPKKK